MVSLQQVQLTLIVLSSISQAVDRAALRAGTDGHAGDGLAATHTVDSACMLWLLQYKKTPSLKQSVVFQ